MAMPSCQGTRGHSGAIRLASARWRSASGIRHARSALGLVLVEKPSGFEQRFETFRKTFVAECGKSRQTMALAFRLANAALPEWGEQPQALQPSHLLESFRPGVLIHQI